MSENFKRAKLEDIANKLKDFDNFVVCGHINPDGDSIGSCNCLKFALEKQNKHVDINTTDKKNYCFIQMDVQPNHRLENDCFKSKENAAFTICIDHHQAEEPNCNLVYVDSKAASNSLNVWDLIKLMNVEIDKDMASAAYFGLCSDTNSFTNTNTDIRCFEAAKTMLKYGADPSKIAVELFQSRSLKSINLEKITIENMYIDKELRFALSFLTSDDYTKFDATKKDSDHAIDYMRQLKCVDVVCLLRQENPGDQVHGSLRSKTNVDVSLLAKKHIGGGHKAASGFTVESTDLDATYNLIKNQLQDLMKAHMGA